MEFHNTFSCILFRTLDGPSKIVHVSRNLLARFHTKGVDRFYSEMSQNDRHDVTLWKVKRFLWKRVAFECGCKFNRKNAYFSTKKDFISEIVASKPVHFHT